MSYNKDFFLFKFKFSNGYYKNFGVTFKKILQNILVNSYDNMDKRFVRIFWRDFIYLFL